MAGTAERDPRWFGPSLAALLQRVIDRSDLQVGHLVGVPERLFGRDGLLDWVVENADAAAALGLSFEPAVDADAARFFAAVAAAGSGEGG